MQTGFAYKFAQISDTHIEVGEQKISDSERRLSLSIQLLQNAIEDINNNPEIEFVVLTGDVINNGRSWNLDSAQFILDKLDKSFFVVIGNNDFAFPASGIGISKTTFHTAFSDNEPNISSGIWFGFPLPDVMILGVDNINPISGAEVWTKKKLEKIETLLEEHSEKDIIVLLHYPVTELDYVSNGELLNSAKPFIDLCNNYSVDIICSGHYHYSETQQPDILINVVCPALVEFPHEYLIFDVQEDKINIQSKRIADGYTTRESEKKMNQKIQKLSYIYNDINEEQILKKITFEEVNYGRR